MIQISDHRPKTLLRQKTGHLKSQMQAIPQGQAQLSPDIRHLCRPELQPDELDMA